MEPTDFGKYVVLHIPNLNKFIKIVCLIPSFISLDKMPWQTILMQSDTNADTINSPLSYNKPFLSVWGGGVVVILISP